MIASSCETSWQKAAEIGKGPPYPRRRTRRPGDGGPIVIRADELDTSADAGGGGTAERKIEVLDKDEERRFVVGRTGKRIRVPWARNLLATEEELFSEMEKLGLDG